MNLLKSAATALLLALTTLVCAAPAAAQTVEYVHTDALGSVVAVTDANRNIVERREYEPYGYQLTPTLQNGPGYTGHVQDASTGLTYMQQRYYDPLLGRFLSVDPVTMHDNGDPRLFNRYGYANNNPYAYVDPDGRFAQFVWGAVIGAGVEVFVQVAVQGKSLAEVDLTDVAVAAGAGAITGGIASAATLAAARSTISVGQAVARTSIGSGATAVNASLAADSLNGVSPDVGEALVAGAGAAALGGVGQRASLGKLATLEGMSARGGLAATVGETTASANMAGGSAARVAAATSEFGSNASEVLGVTVEVEDRYRETRNGN